MSHNNRYTKAEIRAQIKEKKRMKALALQRNITVFALLIMLVLGLVSTTFSAFVAESTEKSGTLVADIQTLAVNQGNKDQVANLGANADIASTGVNTVSGGYIYFDNTKTQWTDSCIQFVIGHNNGKGFSRTYTMSKISNTNLYYVNLSNSTYHDWGDATYYAVIGTSDKWGDGEWGSSNLTNANHRTAAYTTAYNMDGDTKRHLVTTTGSSNGTSINIAYQGTAYSSLNKAQTVYVRSAAAGSSTYSNDASAGTAKVAGYYLSANSTATSRSATTVLGSTNNCNASLAPGSTITLTATANTGYNFVGWYDASGNQLSTSATYTTTHTGSAVSYYARFQKTGYSFTVTTNTSSGGTVSPTSGSNVTSATITATAKTGYTFVEWTVTGSGSVANATSASTTLTLTGNGAVAKANFRPNAPSALTLTASNVASGTSGTGTSDNPYIVFDDGGFTLTASSSVATGASKYYSTTATGTYSTTSAFSPALSTKGVNQTYTVYAKAYAGGYYSTSYISASAYYMVFSHLDGANTGFTMSSDNITDAESVTFSGAYVNGVEDAEKAYITQSYQISTDNSTFSDITGSSWTPNAIGTYYFRLKTTNSKTGETVYSTSKSLIVEQSTVYYPITVVNDGTVGGTVTLKADGVTITDGQILSNSKLTISVTRPNSNYYIEYLDVDTISEFDNMNVNGDITDYVAYDHVKGNVEIHYKLTEKPKVTVSKPANSSAMQFAYYFDGVATDANAAGTYHVDYDTRIRYSVTPNAGYYVKSMTGVTIGEITASTVVGAKNNVTADIASVTATLVNNNTVTVNVDTNSAVTEGGTMTIDGTAHAFGDAKALNYGTESEIVITPPDGCYAFVSGNDITPAISTDGKSTFKVKLTGANKTYTVKFLQNPKIYMVQPQYGSVYVNDNDGNYYFNGDPVGYGTELTVNVKPDHANAVLSDVLVNDASIGTVDGSKFNITVDSTATATITVASDFSFNDNTAYGTRRVFFTDNAGWGNSNAANVLVHCSNTVNDTDFTSGNIAMTRKYYNEYSQYVYYADIPFSTKYVTFVNKANTTQYSQQGTILNTNNAFYMDSSGNYPRALYAWNYNYSDYVATDRVDTIQQAVTSKGEPVTFQYTCDFGDDTLSVEKVAGNEVTCDFDRGTLSITPTQNTYSYSLVKVTSAASTTVKYYLIRVENFEIYSFTGLQKIYKANVLNNIQLDLILKGGILNYAADFFVSDTNATNSYSILEISQSSGFTKLDSIEGYINSFLINYALSGVKYFRVDASDSANHKASAYMKTLFGTNTYEGERVLYFYNNTNVNIAKYNLRACFKNAGDDYVWATMQPVGDTNYYRAVIPRDYSTEVDFFLTSKKTFTYNRDDIINTDNTLNTEFCSYGVINVTVPVADTANIVYAVNSIDTNGGINGEFAEFDY